MLSITAPEAFEPSLSPGSYLTDGTRLFRVVAKLLDPWRGQVVELEDCVTLATSLYSPEELRALGVRPVHLHR